MDDPRSTTEALACPHCGKSLGPKLSLKLRASTADVGFVLCPACGRFVRHADFAQALATAGSWALETCWFCETRPADEAAVLTVFCVGQARPVEQAGISSVKTPYYSVPVPRCATCKRAHRLRKALPALLAPLLPVIFLGGTLLAWTALLNALSPDMVERLIPAVPITFVLAFGAVAVVVYAILLGWLTKRLIPDNAAIKDVGCARNYPVVAALESQGFAMQKPTG